MPTIHLTTLIQAPIEKVFDISRDIGLHEASMHDSEEKAIAGRTTGLIEEGETVTWEARHFFKTRHLTSCITKMQPYTFFTDEMMKGDFKSIKHHHYFRTIDGGTEMKDEFNYESPYGIIGALANMLFINRYLTKLLKQRNQFIKTTAEQL
jgi:ligand-binding SRPBCC domain-containing protein